MQAQMSVAGLGTTPVFPFHRGGRQGGVETPPIFRMISGFLLGPMVRHWDFAGYRFPLDGNTHLHHLIWCDNLYLIATSQAQAK